MFIAGQLTWAAISISLSQSGLNASVCMYGEEGVRSKRQAFVPGTEHGINRLPSFGPLTHA